MRPLIFYVDDEPRNLAVFEASITKDWEIVTFSAPLKALEALENLEPWVIVSDQRMPGMTGVQFLEKCKELQGDAVRIVVTGYSEEELVVESVRRAQIFDYIKKPWETDDLEASLTRGVEFFRANAEAKRLQGELIERERLLEKQNAELKTLARGLEEAHSRESDLRKELECWVPPFLLWHLKEKNLEFPVQRDIVGICFDIVNSARIHGVEVHGVRLRAKVLQLFSEAVIRNGGWRESHSGDSAYGHFGLLNGEVDPYTAAFTAALEFRSALDLLTADLKTPLSCGISLHVATNCIVDVHTVSLETARGTVIQKSFDTTSSDVDLLHRMEKLVHELVGANIIMSKEYLDALGKVMEEQELVSLGALTFKGQNEPVDVYVLPSKYVQRNEVELLKQKLCSTQSGRTPRAA